MYVNRIANANTALYQLSSLTKRHPFYGKKTLALANKGVPIAVVNQK